jgi:transposase
VVTGANANEGVQARAVLDALVIRPPGPDRPNPAPDPRDLPRVRADGAYGNRPTRQRATDAGFRMEAPSRGRARRPGVGRVRCAVERGHAFLSQFGRVARRFDRDDRRYLGWVQLASAVIFIRHEANGFFR